MNRFYFLILVLLSLTSCSKEEIVHTAVTIPDDISGVVNEIKVTPTNITTPDKASFTISANNTIYRVEFNATTQDQSNGTLRFELDSIITNDSREYTNLGKDEISYNPVANNSVEIRYNTGKKIFGQFFINTSFGGVFGEALITQWRVSNDPAKPNQKATDDIRNFVRRYADKDGPGPGTAPVYLFFTVNKL